MSRFASAWPASITSIEPIAPPVSPIAVAMRPSVPGPRGISMRRRSEYWALGVVIQAKDTMGRWRRSSS